MFTQRKQACMQKIGFFLAISNLSKFVNYTGPVFHHALQFIIKFNSSAYEVKNKSSLFESPLKMR